MLLHAKLQDFLLVISLGMRLSLLYFFGRIVVFYLLKRLGRGSRLIGVLSVILGITNCTSVHADESTTSPTWVARFRSEAPAEYAKLESAVGHWEFSYLSTYDYYPRDGTLKVTRQIKNEVRAVFDQQLQGIRGESTTLSDTRNPATRPSTTAGARNPEYSFTVDREGNRPFLISTYDEIPSEPDKAKTWRQQLDLYRGLTAEDFDGSSLLQMLNEGQVKIQAADVVNVDGRECVLFKLSAPTGNASVGSIVLDPTFHWAVRSFEHYFPTGGHRRTVVTYNKDVNEVAVPKEIVEEDFGPKGEPQCKNVMDFQAPQISHAQAKDFTLEAFGLERPNLASAPPAKNYTLLGLIFICVAAAIFFVVIAVFRRSNHGGSRGNSGNDTPS